MTSLLLAVLWVVAAPVPNVHDAVMAVFHLTEEEDHLSLLVTFDTEDFCAERHLDQRAITLLDAATYIKETTEWTVNDKVLELTPVRLSQDNDHHRIAFTISKKDAAIHRLVIKNHFLTNVKSHSNIMMLDVGEGFRDFRMNADRREITVEY